MLPPFARKLLLLSAGGLGLLAASVFAANALLEPRQGLKAYLFPREKPLYVLDERAGRDFASELARLYPEARQRQNGVRIVVRTVHREALAGSPEALIERFAQSAGPDELSPLFIRATPPLAFQKQARNKIENALHGEQRARLLRRTAPLLAAQGASAQASCEALRQGWIYAMDTFYAQGLALDDRQNLDLPSCLPELLDAFASSYS